MAVSLPWRDDRAIIYELGRSHSNGFTAKADVLQRTLRGVPGSRSGDWHAVPELDVARGGQRGCVTERVSATAENQDARPRAREIGIAPGVLRAGPLNAITDVAGVRVGNVTLVEGDDIRTGVTAILPHGGNLFQDKVPAGFAVGNAYGKFAGSTQIDELGEIEAPIVLTNTLSVADGNRGRGTTNTVQVLALYIPDARLLFRRLRLEPGFLPALRRSGAR